ncbi:EFR1 family ferrodoxin [Marinifilum flexuosum]|uniref:EFR1 family ferrodoxin n=1 Tax=Marinifilum flexuosum TaxID=1117708 RepID=UPI0024913455|nr:EFR1 family ferrodoxin [Marinifilum flexuosum]
MSSINLIYFSPTNTSKKIAQYIGRELDVQVISEFDITKPDLTDLESKRFENELTLMAIPVYKGRLPKEAVARLRKCKANKAPVIIVVVYGNREFDDALLELNDLSIELGFVPIAAAAFIGEHSYSSEDKPIAHNRPDCEDILKAKEFANKVVAKIQNTDESQVKVPGNYPYKELPQALAMAPRTIAENCSLCGICADVCPMNIIEIKESVITNAEDCIWCCACVKSCPEDARLFDTPFMGQIKNMLFKNCSERKEPEFFV